MDQLDVDQADIDRAGEDLFNYAVDREEIKWQMDRLQKEAHINRTTVEYELAVLKIVATGLAISFHLERSPHKQALLENYWKRVYELSNGLSETAGILTGTGIDYFQVLKDRLDGYTRAISESEAAKTANDPSVAIGPEFAEICGNRDDIYTRMTGIRMFTTNITRVGQYLEGISITTQGPANEDHRGNKS